jgi:hypothetical protein
MVSSKEDSMGIIRAGILSKVSGKVAGVVGGSWKDKAYLREYVIPANPNTTLQQAQRSKMRIGVAFAKVLVGQVFNVYTDKFERSMTGFNRFLMDNMSHFLTPIEYSSIIVTNGKLWAPPVTAALKIGDTITMAWTAASLGNNGAATDKVYSIAYNLVTGLWYFAAEEVNRSTGTTTITVPAANGATDFVTWTWAAKYSLTSPTLLEMISASQYRATSAT